MPPNDPQPGETWRCEATGETVRFVGIEMDGLLEMAVISTSLGAFLGTASMPLGHFLNEYEYVAAPEDGD